MVLREECFIPVFEALWIRPAECSLLGVLAATPAHPHDHPIAAAAMDVDEMQSEPAPIAPVLFEPGWLESVRFSPPAATPAKLPGSDSTAAAPPPPHYLAPVGSPPTPDRDGRGKMVP